LAIAPAIRCPVLKKYQEVSRRSCQKMTAYRKADLPDCRRESSCYEAGQLSGGVNV
jgi:hypothetical protein